MPEHNSTGSQEANEISKSRAKGLFGLYEIVLIVLMLLSVIGIGITDYSPKDSHRYWLSMVPIFALACIFLEQANPRNKDQKWTSILRIQIPLWLGLLLAVKLVYMMLHAGRLNSENTGLVILLLLSLTTFFAGIELDWRVSTVGIFLGATLLGAAYEEEFLWIFLLIAGVVIAIFLLLKHYENKKKI